MFAAQYRMAFDPKRPLLFTSLFLLGLRTVAQGLGPIGSWQDHLPYHEAYSVAVGGGQVYCATRTAAFRLDPGTGEVERITKINGLNDIGINGLAWNQQLSLLLVYYTNGNLDLLYPGGGSRNMGDIKRAGITGSKQVNNALMDGGTAYLACAFGVVVVDLAAREVRDTWFIGPGGSQVNVSGLAIHGDSIYAATDEGLFVAYRYAGNLASFTNWHQRADLPSAMANGPFDAVVSFGGRLLLNFRQGGDADTLLLLNGTEVTRFEGLNGVRNRWFRVSAEGDRLVVTNNDAVRTFGSEMELVQTQTGYAGTWMEAMQAEPGPPGAIWVADRRLGLARGTGEWDGYAIKPPGPANASVHRMSAQQGVVYASTGAVSGTWGNVFHKGGIHRYANSAWVTYNWENTPIMLGDNDFAGAANDMIAMVVDPADPGRAFAGSWDDGLLEFRDGVPVKWHNSTNSSLQDEINGPLGKVNVGGLAFDSGGDLWITNPYAAAVLSVYTRQGSWKAFTPGSMLNGNFLVSDLVAATNGQKWVVRARGNGLLVFDDGGTIEDTGDDRYKLLTNQEGGLPTNDVRCVAEDHNGHVWVGTAQGPVVFYDPLGIFGSNAQEAQQILIEQDGNVQVLLGTEVVTAIAVDGANRKWIGTETSGVFLIATDGRTQVAHFTTANSPLPSDRINTIAMDGLTGEVFFGTDQGIMSFRSDATEGSLSSECAKVFPNPVRETHTSPVAITGLVRDSEVKITDVAGNLVYRTTSLGGQAIWPVTDMSGNRVATGVYLILASDRPGFSKCNTKVLVIR